MAEWWENFATDAQRYGRALGDTLGDFGQRLPNELTRAGINVLRSIPLIGPMVQGGVQAVAPAQQTGKYESPQVRAAAEKQARDLAALGGADALRQQVSNELSTQQAAAMPEGYSFDQFMADLLGMTGGSGGGVDLSGYNEMLADVAAREAGLGTRKGEQEAFLSALFDAAEQRMISDRDALAGAVQAALDADAARRATEIGLIRGDEANRLATATAAREALGVQGGEDLSSQVAQNAVAGVGAAGSVSERDARINEAIQRQQLQSQIAGLTPMEQMAASQLSRGYEDRLAALASERAAIRNQMAQARSAASGRGGLGIGEVLSAMGAYNEMFGPGEAPDIPGVLGFVQGAQAGTGQTGFINDLVAIGDRIITSPTISRLDPTSPAGANEILQSLIASDPRVANIVNSNPGAAGFIIQYVTSAGKAQ